MRKAIHFETNIFDVTLEEENPINPIYGSSLIIWLKEKLKDIVEIDEPMAEDWGWYTLIDFNGRQYLIGTCGLADEGYQAGDSIEWILQIDKYRSFKEKLLGREKMVEDDPCFQYFKRTLENEVEFINVEVA